MKVLSATRWLIHATSALCALVVLVPAASAEIDEAALRDLRAGLDRCKKPRAAVSAHVSERIEIHGRTPWYEEPRRQDPQLKGEAIYITWGTEPGTRTYDWLWAGDRWRLREARPLGTRGSRVSDTRSDGKQLTSLSYQDGHPRTAQGDIDRPRGTWPTPATFAYMPDGVWAADMLRRMHIETVRRTRAAGGADLIECVGHDRYGSAQLTFDPARNYAIVRQAREGEKVAYEELVTQWKTVGGISVPIAMEQRMRSGPKLTSPLWRTMRITLTDLKAVPAKDADFRQAWPDGAQVIDRTEDKMYRVEGGRMVFVMHVGGMTPQRRLLGWCVIGAPALGGLFGIRALARRRARRGGPV